ncbi:beta-propeller fold lactonase family protein [Gryllotalpicola daejeonensis]|uniref:Beta-propeller fold lactonase family protein n=1 Tax=Gryllotalpicola daejeonensis TaxID=993087 RepID=A0ABP7ZKC0_9MICO
MAASVWLGGYTPDMDGVGEGILHASVEADGMLTEVKLAAATPSPSFVAQHPSLPVLYAVGEKDATFRAFSIGTGGALAPLGEPVAAGEAACHIAIDPDGRFAVVACWGSGEVLVYALDAQTGAISGRTDASAALDPYAGVPETEMVAPRPDYAPRVSRAHYTQFLADGRVLTIDLGFDLARVWRFDAASGALELDYQVVFPYGVGPRHVAAASDGRLYVICEYAVSVFVLAPGADGRYAIAGSSPLRSVPREAGEYAAHLSLSDDETLLYATVRRSNVVAVLAVGAPGAGEAPRPVASVPSGADWPRHHFVQGSRLYVANQLGGEVTVFALGADGVPGEIVQRVPAGSPTAVVPAFL